ncbi:MAG: [FeFe] hydrogenase H-cluster maturation GTPase HydF [Desulfobacterota bacterium]|nr:[FeFe] hydrogenase H-cluster maturation GTPase HydF [Thermodesulfobacteriota bacterium]
MHTTPVSNRLHIGIFGKRNVGKSSFINALTGQNIAIVSDQPGTTTDPVGKSMEIAGIGPVYLYDTAGIDDSGELGLKRVGKTKQVMNKINLALVIVTAEGFDEADIRLVEELHSRGCDIIVVCNKIDILQPNGAILERIAGYGIPCVRVSCATREGIEEAKQTIIERGSKISPEQPSLIGDIIQPGELVLLVVPIDLGAPKGRLILPQVQVIRDILDHNAVALTAKEHELLDSLKMLTHPPSLVICDSQVVKKVADAIPPDIKFTTFSILFSRQKGDLATFVRGVRQIDRLQDGDTVLIMEACTHHPMPDDIGRVKLPRWIRQFTGRDILFDVNAGPLLDKDLSTYRLIIACGGCMINRQEMLFRIKAAHAARIPITNYGIAISYVHGVLQRVLSPFPHERTLCNMPAAMLAVDL